MDEKKTREVIDIKRIVDALEEAGCVVTEFRRDPLTGDFSVAIEPPKKRLATS